MEENSLFNEMEGLRREMQAFKAQLDRQTIVNERLLAASMRKNMSWIRKFVVMECLTFPLILFLWLVLKKVMGFSWLFFAFTMFMITLELIGDYRINVSSLHDADYSHDNLVTTASKLCRMKHLRRMKMLLELPFLVMWFVWFALEKWMAVSPSADIITACADVFFLAFCFVLGVLVAYYFYRRMQKTNDTLIAQIRELTEQD